MCTLIDLIDLLNHTSAARVFGYFVFIIVLFAIIFNGKALNFTWNINRKKEQ